MVLLRLLPFLFTSLFDPVQPWGHANIKSLVHGLVSRTLTIWVTKWALPCNGTVIVAQYHMHIKRYCIPVASRDYVHIHTALCAIAETQGTVLSCIPVSLLLKSLSPSLSLEVHPRADAKPSLKNLHCTRTVPMINSSAVTLCGGASSAYIRTLSQIQSPSWPSDKINQSDQVSNHSIPCCQVIVSQFYPSIVRPSAAVFVLSEHRSASLVLEGE